MVDSKTGQRGLSLVELLVTLALGGVFLVTIFSVYRSFCSTSTVQNEMVRMQQGVRAAMDMLVFDLRAAGYDPQRSGQFGIMDIRCRNQRYRPSVNGQGALEFSSDFNENAVLDATTERLSYSIADFPISAPDGISDLALRRGTRRDLLVEGVEGLAFAFAFDYDGDGALDCSPNGHVIWAVDADNDNVVDTKLDVNDDGLIDMNDPLSGVPLAVPVADLRRLKAVKVWLLGRTLRSDRDFKALKTYRLGNRILRFQDGVHRRLVSTVIQFRNVAW